QILSFDTSSDASVRVSGTARARNAVWSHDGRRIAYQSPAGITLRNADGSREEELVLPPGRVTTLTDWTPDGRLVYSVPGPSSLSDLWTLMPGRDLKPAPFLETSFNKTQANVSPDGRWIAYTSYESGRDEVYVDTFPTPRAKHRVSAAGGVQP